jgi:hypothetical protein
MMRFEKKVSIDIQHDYFDKGPAAGIDIQPTSQCGRLLKNFRLSIKNKSGLIIFADEEITGGSSQIKSAPNEAFDFLIFVNDTWFFTYTSLIPKKEDQIYLFSNIKGEANLKLTVEPLSRFNIRETRSVFGIIRLCFNFTPPASFILNFKARKLKWKYYVLTTPAIANPVVDSSLPGILFIKQTPDKQATDTISDVLVSRFPTAIVSVFESDKEIALNQAGKKGIRLKNSINNMIVINHLPNPGANENGIKIINLLN